MAGVLRTEAGTLAPGFGESLGEREVLSRPWEQPGLLASNPDILDVGRVK